MRWDGQYSGKFASLTKYLRLTENLRIRLILVLPTESQKVIACPFSAEHNRLYQVGRSTLGDLFFTFLPVHIGSV
jgi:hypothetical protein